MFSIRIQTGCRATDSDPLLKRQSSHGARGFESQIWIIQLGCSWYVFWVFSLVGSVNSVCLLQLPVLK